MNEIEIKSFWEGNLCGTGQVADHAADFAAFFHRYDSFRYRDEAHIPGCLDRFDLTGRRVLEIGLGQGAGSEQIIRRGGDWRGLDLTEESCGRVKARMQVRGLSSRGVVCGSARQIPLHDDQFDYVFSHVVLHHIVEIGDTQAEIARVLKLGGRLVMMVYARHSLNYWLAIAVLRRIALLLICLLRMPGERCPGYHPNRNPDQDEDECSGREPDHLQGDGRRRAGKQDIQRPYRDQHSDDDRHHGICPGKYRSEGGWSQDNRSKESLEHTTRNHFRCAP